MAPATPAAGNAARAPAAPTSAPHAPSEATPPTASPAAPAANAAAAPDPVKVARVDGVFAEPISPATAARFPHLKAFQSHLLLAGPNVQVVLAGVPPEPSGEEWQPAVVAFAERRAGVWRVMSGMGHAEISGRAAGGPLYRPVGVNIGADRAKGLAFATYVFAGTTPEAPRQVVTFRLDGAAGRLSLLPEAFGPAPSPKASKPLPILWKLRFRAVGALNLAARDAQMGGFRGIPYLIRYQGAELLSVIGFRPFDVDEQLGQLTLTPEIGQSAPLVEGWQILVGRDAALGTLAAAGTIQTCMYEADRAAPKLVAGCSADAAFGALRLALPPGDAGRQDVAQPVFVYDAAGNPIFYTALFAGEAVKADLPRARGYRLADTRSGRALKDLAAFAVEDAAGFKADLPARGAGRLVVDPGADRSPALVTVNRLDQPKGLAIAPGLAEPSGHFTQLSPNSFLVREWPAELPLLAGAYAIELARGSDGVFCNVRAQIAANQRRQHLCPEPTFKTEIAADADFVAADLTATAVQTEGELGDTLKKIYGVSFFPPALAAVDDETGLELRFIAAGADGQALAQRWAGARGKGRAGNLPAFAKFIRAQPEAAAGLLELGCPAPGITLAEYERVAARLNADAVRLFGCVSGVEQNEQLAAAARIVRRKKAPLAITPVAALAHAVSGSFFPRLFLPAKELGTPPALAAFLARVKAGEAVATAGAVVRVTGVKARGSDYELSVDVTASPEVRPRFVFVYTEAGQIKKEPVPDGDGPVKSLTIVVRAPDARWVRVEARGSSRRAAVSQLFDRNYGTALATTGFRALKPDVAH